MLSSLILDLKPDYQNGEDNIGRDLIEPCLKECTRYRRGTGFFSATALNAYSGSLDRLVGDEVKIEIICSPKITSKETIEILNRNSTDAQRRETIEKLRYEIPLLAIGYPFKVKTLLEAPTEDEDQARREEFSYRSKLLSYFIASGVITLKIAIPRHFNSYELREDKLYHIKNGYFVFPDGSCVAFEGSVNESSDGHGNNIDSAQVFRSWEPQDDSRLKRLVERLDNDWTGKNPHIEVYELSPEALKIIKNHSDGTRPKRSTKRTPRIEPEECPDNESTALIKFPDWLWEHQRRAVEAFLQEQRGILEMATGTGKTRTALEIIRQLYLSGRVTSVIVCTYGTDLLEQWALELQKWMLSDPSVLSQPLTILKSYDRFHEEVSFQLNPNRTILLISRAAQSLDRLLFILNHRKVDKKKTLVIHDEVHGFGSKESVNKLRGTHGDFGYCLGLSATPEREYDLEGTGFLRSEIGDVIFQYDLELAIKDGVLCGFNYHPLEFDYSEEDAANRQMVYRRKAAAAKEGKPWSEERTYIELSKVNKKASMKPRTLDEFLRTHSNLVKSSIFFVLDKEQGDTICEVLYKYTHNYRTYYAGTESHFLTQLSNGVIDTLVACERLNEGVDIRSLNTVFLVASDKARLNTIQRIGRCLRTDPNNESKRATVVDFIPRDSSQREDGAEFLRMQWLSNLANIN